MAISAVTLYRPDWPAFQEPQERILLQLFSEPCSPELIVNRLASIEGAVDVYCWYEGAFFLPESGARFMKEQIFSPLYQLKQDVKLCLYSLRAWDFKRDIAAMPSSTPLGEAINRINTAALECIYSSSFFQYCVQATKEGGLYAFLNEELPKKHWLFELSDNRSKLGATVGDFFNHQPSLFDCIKDLPLASAYSSIQYVEGYYLVRESVKKGLLHKEKRIEIAFVLPNDESKYYRDLPKDIETMLRLDFEKDLADIEITIRFLFFKYGDSINSRPYIDKQPRARKVNPKDIGPYFNYLPQQTFSKEQPRMCIPRDLIHNLNGWY